MYLADNAERLKDLKRFCSLLEKLEKRRNTRLLKECDGRMDWPLRGVYFFFDNHEKRTESCVGQRLVRVGTHALKADSNTTLWNRLSQHRGVKKTGGGNHRGSIFRLLVGQALIERDQLKSDSWGQGNTASREITDKELDIEKMVSQYIGNLPFLWLNVEDDAGPNSLRGVFERNSISLLSNYNKTEINKQPAQWLGHFSNRERVRSSGLWNQNHVDEYYDPQFLDILESLINKQ